MIADNIEDVNEIKPDVWLVIWRTLVDLVRYCYVVIPIALIFVLNDSFSLEKFPTSSDFGRYDPDVSAIFSMKTLLGLCRGYLTFLIMAFYLCLLTHLQRVGLSKFDILAKRIVQISPSLLWATFLYMLLFAVGSIFLIIPGLYVLITMMFFSVELFLSASSGKKSLYDSWNITHNFKWWLVKAMFCMFLICMGIRIGYTTLEFNFIFSRESQAISHNISYALLYAAASLFILNIHGELRQTISSRKAFEKQMQVLHTEESNQA